jgi:hypothetical protein
MFRTRRNRYRLRVIGVFWQLARQQRCDLAPAPEDDKFAIRNWEQLSQFSPNRKTIMTKPARIGVILNEELAVEIYKCKLALRISSGQSPRCFDADEKRRGKSVPVSSQFNVSPKTIRDIWSRRTWAHATYHLWFEEEEVGNVNVKGRNSLTLVREFDDNAAVGRSPDILLDRRSL